jgi:hypothetical protein
MGKANKQKTIKKDQKGGCIGAACRRMTNKVRNMISPKPEFPAYEKPTLDNKPPGLEFYDKMVEYLRRIERRNKEEEMQEACQKVIAFILLTDTSSDIVNILKRISSNPPKALIIELREFLEEIIHEGEQEEQDIFFIGEKWTQQVLAKLRGRNLASVKASSRDGFEAIVPGGAGPAGLVSEFLGGPQITNVKKNQTLRRRRHSITAEEQLRRLKEVGTSEHGSGVGAGVKILGFNFPAMKRGNNNFFVRNYKIHLNKNERYE